MPRANNSDENWIGITFANGWEVIKEIGYAEGCEMGFGSNNKHYACYNHNCGIDTFMERTSMRRYINDPSITCVGKCRGCINGSKYDAGKCWYAKKVRKKPLYKVPDREQKVFPGEVYGNFEVISISASGNNKGHQCQAHVRCRHCGAEKDASFSAVLTCAVACECFRNHSSGEKIIKSYLDEHNIPYISEYTFNDLYGTGSGALRYDFAIMNGDVPTMLIEFDGAQHFEEAGSYYNPTGKVQVHDNIKDTYAKEHNIPLLRIPYTEVLNIDNILGTVFSV